MNEEPENGDALGALVLVGVIALAMVGRLVESDELAAKAQRHPDAGLLRSAEALRLAFRDTPPGHLDRVLVDMNFGTASSSPLC